MCALRTASFVGALLAALCGAAVESAEGQVSLPVFGSTPQTEHLETTLSTPVSFSFGALPVGRFAEEFGRRFGVTTVVDRRALDDVGLSLETPVPAMAFDHVTAEVALTTLLDELDLTFLTRDSLLVITTPEEAENRLETRVYPVADLVSVIENGRVDSDPAHADFDSLINVITTTVDPETWEDVGGVGAVSAFPNAQALIITQTREVHKRVEQLLATLRRVKTLQGTPNIQGKPGQPVHAGPTTGQGPFAQTHRSAAARLETP